MTRSTGPRFSRVLLGAAILSALAGCGSDKKRSHSDPFPERELRQAVASASAVHVKDLVSLIGRGPLGRAHHVSDPSRDMPLTLVLLDLPAGPAMSPAMRAEFRLLAGSSAELVTGIPKPDNMNENPPVNLVRPEDVKKIACEVKDDRAEGTVAIERKDLFRATVQFSARLVKGEWQIEEFRMPAYGIRTTRQSPERWQVNDRKPQLRRPIRQLVLREQTDGHSTQGIARVLLLASPAEKARKGVHINTYLYDYRGEQAVAVMKQIAKESGGRFKQISADDR